MERTIIVGAGYAGLLCAARLARKWHGKITIVDPREHFVERVRLHQDVAHGRRPRVPLARLLRGTGVELLKGWASEIDFGNRRLRIGARNEAFDELVIATGSVAPKGTRSIATEEDLPGQRPSIVVGGGLTGIELAAELGNVKLVTDTLGPSLGDKARAHVRRALARANVTVIEGRRVVAVEDDAVILDDGRALDGKPIECVGFRPAPLPEGIATDKLGRAFVDARLRSLSHPFVHVVGDAARVEIGGRPLRMACATANPMGAYAADDIAGTPYPFRFAYYLQCVSLGRRDAIVQRVDAFDRPLPRSFGGRPAAWVKEGLCRFAVGAAVLERWAIPYAWPKLPATVSVDA